MGTLAIRSQLFPKAIGYALYIGAAGYLGATVAFFLFGAVPVYVDALTAGELIWVLWITIFGAKETR